MTAIVLVVEDEALLRINATTIAQEAGFLVLEASNADEAIRILEDRDDIRIVFSDIQMPGSMDGLGLAVVIGNRWPPITIILTSGKVRPDKLADNISYVAKPYAPEALTDLLVRLAA
jgi:CheY-like chemotaxis protein